MCIRDRISMLHLLTVRQLEFETRFSFVPAGSDTGLTGWLRILCITGYIGTVSYTHLAYALRKLPGIQPMVAVWCFTAF